MLKFTINKDGSYSHYGTDGTIEFDDTFNENNEPFNHDYIDGKWVLNEEKLKEFKKQELYLKLDDIAKLIYKNNTRYKYHSDYDKYEEEYKIQIANLELELKGL